MCVVRLPRLYSKSERKPVIAPQLRGATTSVLSDLQTGAWKADAFCLDSVGNSAKVSAKVQRHMVAAVY